MSFLYPAFLIGAVATAIPIVLHFLRRDVAPQVPFSAVRLLRRSPVERSHRRRLRDLLLLAARVAALTLLAGAFARPFIPGASASAASICLIAVDRSLSMTAPGEFARALALARRAIDDTHLGERVTLIAFDDRADVVSGPGSASDARAALRNLQAGFGGTRFGSLVTKVAEVAAGSAGRLIVVTDLQRAGWEDERRATLPRSLQVTLLNAGALPANLAVSAVKVEKDRLIASVRDTGGAPRPATVSVSRDERVVASAASTTIADGTVDIAIPYRAPATGSLAVTVDDPVGFAGDNTRYVVLDPVPASTVLVLTTAGAERAGFYVSQALATVSDEPDVHLNVRVVAPDTLALRNDLGTGGVSAVVVLSTRGIDRRSRDALSNFTRQGGGLLVAAGPDVEPAVLASLFDWKPPLAPSGRADGASDNQTGAAPEPPREPVALSVTDLRHPIFRPFGSLAANLGQVRFNRTWRLAPGTWETAARFTDGTPALLERREGQGRVVLFASDFDRRWSDFPLHPSFVPFVVEAVRYVAPVRDVGRDYIVGQAPSGAERRPGVYRAPDTRLVAVNVDSKESASAVLRADEFEGMIDRVETSPVEAAEVRAKQIEARQSYWRYGVLLMVGVLVVESFVGKA